MECLVAVDAIDQLVHDAKPTGSRRRCRIDAEALLAAIDRAQHEITVALASPQNSAALPCLDRLRSLTLEARPVPVLGGVRFDRSAGFDLLDELRQLLANDLKTQGAR
jgi:hypothetical protein